uniref:Protein kinase domain-containing protein n=1 Tax=Mesocestoides corti TaxID=53468 RepID=A0A5K3F8I1_MESCO
MPEPESQLYVFQSRQIGSSQFAEVVLGSYENRTVAVKQLPTITPTAEMLRQLNFLKSLDLSKCVQVFEVFGMPQCRGSVQIVMENMACGSVAQYLSTQESQSDAVTLLHLLIQRVAAGMAYLEGYQIAHTDLKTSNVLLDFNGIVKITDVGFRHMLTLASGFNQEWFPFDEWSAPELSHQPTAFSLKADVWSFGILCFVILTRGGHPYPGIPLKALPSYLANQMVPPNPAELGHQCSDFFYDLLVSCWRYNPQERPSFRSIINSLTMDNGKYENITSA